MAAYITPIINNALGEQSRLPIYTRHWSSAEILSSITRAVNASLKPAEAEESEKKLSADLQAVTKKIDSLAAMLAGTSTLAALL